MLIYTLRRLNLFIITLLLLTVVSYSILRLDPSSALSSQEFWHGWLVYLSMLAEGDLGINANGVSIADQILIVFPATLELCIFAFLCALVIGIPLGTLAGIRQGGLLDRGITTIALLGFSMPVFWLAMLLLMLFSLHLGWLPVSGRYSLLYEIDHITGFALIDIWLSPQPYRLAAFESALSHLILPSLVLAVAPTTEIITQMRASVATVMQQNYVRTAAVKGLSLYEIVTRHVIRNALPPIIPKFGMQLSTMLAFSMVVESIFNWPGIGRWLLDAIAHQDYIAIQGGVIVVASFVLLANILADLFAAIVNPLVRKEWYAIR
ncbi:Putrescine export system permease protein SapB [Vibrio stylophorae]|uniref:Putrescine export system permease protein SapB n=1 Tax=Vibrio stylophorae TaxID=659351 RepID=A0ABM8ZTX7_9VIBR|nr:ABC transporter permease subunit [Vibrio stylophorae]CAH0533777.1 Putrescine export system permease protein SapB [Vibrio stylophorae]